MGDTQAADVQAAFTPQADGLVDRADVGQPNRVYAPTSYADPADAPGSRATVIDVDSDPVESPLGRLRPGTIEDRADRGEDTSHLVDASPKVGTAEAAHPSQDRAVTEHAADVINSRIAGGGDNLDGRTTVTGG